jgi:hypothetical protein
MNALSENDAAEHPQRRTFGLRKTRMKTTMSKCPVSTLRSWLEPLTARLAKLPVFRGFPVPWFVAKIKGEYEFRAMDPAKITKALNKRLCWCCGQPLDYFATFVIGPMCAINRVSSEPPSHLECARWSSRNCPFLTQRQMERREDETTLSAHVAGVGIKRNPGVALLWTTDKWRPFDAGNGGLLIRIGDPKETEWWSHGRKATRAEVVESVRTGFPILEDMARRDGAGAMRQLAIMAKTAERYYPPEEITA